MRIYSDPTRENDPHALPDVEVWSERTIIYTCCDTEAPESAESCPTCDRQDTASESTGKTKWFYWFCFPGCLPESDGPSGPFDTEAEAIADARAYNEF